MSNSAAGHKWRYEPVETPDGARFDVFEGDDPEPVCRVRREANARRIVNSANETGHPDLVPFAEDCKEDAPLPGPSGRVPGG